MKQDLPQKKADHYFRKFSRKSQKPVSTLESLSDNKSEGSFKESEVPERLEASQQALDKIIEDYLDNDPALKKLAAEILRQGGDALRAVANVDNDYLEDNPRGEQMLEVIVQADGSRPSFLVRNDEVDLKSSPVGDWKGELEASDGDLKKAIKCVGRINIGQRHVGTGFLVSPNLIVTNRHVLQSVTESNGNSDNGPWVFKQGANIDFGCEFRAQASVNLRSLENLIFCGPKYINPKAVDHKKLDLALIELEHVDDDLVPLHILQWDGTTTWVKQGQKVLVIGYPGDPKAQGVINYTSSLLEKLFRSLYSYKRLAPGEVMSSITPGQPMTVDHDATTLGGNSGSLITMAGLETNASGLHYGGELESPRQNWGHVLGLALKNIKDTDEAAFEYMEKEKIAFYL